MPGFGSSDLLLDLDSVAVNSDFELVWDTEQSAADLQEVAAYKQKDYTPVEAEGQATLGSVVDKFDDGGRSQ